MVSCVILEPEQAISGSPIHGNNPKHPISIDYRLQLRFNIIMTLANGTCLNYLSQKMQV
jgi:hypothetical protein